MSTPALSEITNDPPAAPASPCTKPAPPTPVTPLSAKYVTASSTPASLPPPRRAPTLAAAVVRKLDDEKHDDEDNNIANIQPQVQNAPRQDTPTFAIIEDTSTPLDPIPSDPAADTHPAFADHDDAASSTSSSLPVPEAPLPAYGDVFALAQMYDDVEERDAGADAPAALSESASHSSLPATPPRPAPRWGSTPTVARSPKFHLAAAAAARASMLPRPTPEKKPGAKPDNMRAFAQHTQPFRPTRPKSPDFQLAARAALMQPPAADNAREDKGKSMNKTPSVSSDTPFVPTRPKSPNFLLAARASVAAAVAKPAEDAAKPAGSPRRDAGPFRPTVARSPNFHLAAAAAQRSALAPKAEEQAHEQKSSAPEWSKEPTVARSPKLLAKGKALSAAAAARKAELAAARAEAEAQSRAREQRTRVKQQTWARGHGGTRAESPKLSKGPVRSRRVAAKGAEMPVRPRRFTPRPVPRFDDVPAPRVRQTRASMARLERKESAPAAIGRGKREIRRMERTVMQPFGLQSVCKHEEAVAVFGRRMSFEERERERRRTFQPVPLREELLRGATFVPVHDDARRTRPVSLLPEAEERSRRTQMFLAEQMRRVQEMEQAKEMVEREREEREREALQREWRARRFRARPVPRSHYEPHVVVHGRRGEEGMIAAAAEEEEEEEWGEEMGTPEVEVGGTERVSGLLEGLRKSLSPLLGRE